MGRLFFIVCIIILLALFLLYFPIYLQTDAHYDMNGRKLAFCVRAYRFIKLLGGYIATYKGGLAAHISDKKAVLIPYSDLDNERKRFSVIKTFSLRKLEITTETGVEYLLKVAFAQVIFRILFFILQGKKENLDNNVWLREGDVLRISIHVVLRINLYLLLQNFIKNIKEKIKYYVRQKDL